MKPSRRDSFKALITDRLGDLTMSINYSLVDRSGSVPDPTSPPTSQVLQTYPYQTTQLKNLVTIEVSEPVEGPGTVGDGNMLLYLGVTKGQSMHEDGLPWESRLGPQGPGQQPDRRLSCYQPGGPDRQLPDAPSDHYQPGDVL